MNRILGLCLAVMMLFTGVAKGREAGSFIAALSPVDALPEAEWQYTAAFPDWKNYIDDTLAMNSMFSFRGYHGQGKLYFEVAEGVTAFSLYVNGVKYDTSMVGGGIYLADISGSAVDGVNTLQVSNIQPVMPDKAITVYIPYPEVLDSDRGLDGIRPESIKLIEDIIASDIEYGFTSAQLAVVKNGRMVYENAWGRVNSYNPDGTPRADAPMVTPDTLYDLASVTKVFSINYAVQRLATEGLLNVDTPIADILGDAFAEDTLDLVYADDESPVDLETQKAWKHSLTVRDLLQHEAGFPPSPNYNDPDYDFALQKRGEPGSNALYALGREDTLQAIFKTPLLYAPHTRTLYSDLDYMLLTFIVEKLTGQSLDAYMKENFFLPMGLEHIAYMPLENGFEPDDCAATELNGNTRDHHVDYPSVRTRTLQGEVHDERAFYCMEGVSGHAGLFASASDLARLASAMLTGGYGGHRFFSRNVMDAFTAAKSPDAGQWGMGWWRQGDGQRPWYYGTQARSDVIGHQGWTGTLAMIDPSRELVVIYLTNKINTPVLSESAINKFTGGCYTASTLGFVPQLLSIGMDTQQDISEQLLDLLADMAVESVRLSEGKEPPYVQNALSKLALLERRARAAGHVDYMALSEQLQKTLIE